ncbi:ornithine cyclodeaminase family protein [Sphaerisporangium sp. TRM90804]|uniref:ornithine cyclodeaminase family protein n=1 Tax=Sphaerisporangium sp. TRM90804 TaxID=3031113 RepID=UPI002447734B|nr:ornithine cyclodeaminase family protein [Sphaerisporangium sp. TRM90804]MDH2430240.1 ornithine cyclodeaminase family protein [Sphaerisporangium sp. TRM90804]
MSALPYLDGDTLRALVPMEHAVRALAEALEGGLDPETGPLRSAADVPAGQLLLMPAAHAGYAGVKVASVAPANPARGLPRIQGTYLLLDGATLTPLAAMDGAALTALRTPAVSALAVRHLARPDTRTLAVFGTGPQAWGHVAALRAVRPLERVAVVGRDPARAEAFAARCAATGLPAAAVTAKPRPRGAPKGTGRPGARPARAEGAGPGGGSAGARDASDEVAEVVRAAGLIVCCTSAREPLFAGALVAGGATVVAVGSHEPGAREIDGELVARATVVVESRSAALAEAGDLIIPIREGLIGPGHLAGDLAELVTGALKPGDGPRVFKSVGMAWEDLIVAAAAHAAWAAR